MAAKWPENKAQGIEGCMFIEIEQDPWNLDLAIIEL